MPPGAESRSEPNHADPASAQCINDKTFAGSAASSASDPGFGPPVKAGEVGALGPYRVITLLGRGGMGAVYAALDTRLERKLALKVMLPEFAADQAPRERFLREARAAGRIKHDNVVTIYEADERNGIPYIAMEFLEGYPLDEYLKKKGCPTIPQVIRIAAEAAAGLAAAHKTGLIHRDVKPGNLWLEAPHGRVKVLDFGLAKPVDAEVEVTRSGAVVGTPAYMSPEQAWAQKLDHRTDLFSLGAVLYRLCTGRLPFEGPTAMAVLMALGTEEPASVREVNPAVPEALAELIHQLLSKRADARPPSAEAVVKRLRAIGQALAAPRAQPLEQSMSQPPAVSVPIQVTLAPEANPFADIDVSDTEMDSLKSAESSVVTPPPARKKPGARWPWIATGFAAFLAIVGGAIVIIIRNKDGSETKIEVPDGATVTVKDKDGKTLAQAGPGSKKPAAVADPDRRAARYVLELGGSVGVNGEGQDLKTVAELPKNHFILDRVDLTEKKGLTDAGMANFEGCKGLKALNLTHTQVSDAGLAHIKDCKALTAVWLIETKVTDDGMAYLKDCKELTTIWLSNTQVTDKGLAHIKDCKDLANLYLDIPQGTDAGLVFFKDCNVKNLSLMSMPITDAGLAQFKYFKNLNGLFLGATKVTDAGLAPFKDCKELNQLVLGYTQVSDVGLAYFKECKNLNWLDVGTTKVTDAGLAPFKDCKELTELRLYETQVSDVGLAYFKDCKKLNQLNVKISKVTAKGLAEFHKAVPGCKIEHDGGVIEPKK